MTAKNIDIQVSVEKGIWIKCSTVETTATKLTCTTKNSFETYKYLTKLTQHSDYNLALALKIDGRLYSPSGVKVFEIENVGISRGNDRVTKIHIHLKTAYRNWRHRL